MLLDDMIDTLHEAEGVGLAGAAGGRAQESGGHRICGEGVIELINPRNNQYGGEKQTDAEGCLSYPPENTALVTRPNKATVRALNRDGETVEYRRRGGFWRERFVSELDHP